MCCFVHHVNFSFGTYVNTVLTVHAQHPIFVYECRQNFSSTTLSLTNRVHLTPQLSLCVSTCLYDLVVCDADNGGRSNR